MNRRRFLGGALVATPVVALAPWDRLLAWLKPAKPLMLESNTATLEALASTLRVDSPFPSGTPILIPRTGERLVVVAIDQAKATITVSGRQPQIPVRSALCNDEQVRVIGSSHGANR